MRNVPIAEIPGASADLPNAWLAWMLARAPGTGAIAASILLLIAGDLPWLASAPDPLLPDSVFGVGHQALSVLAGGLVLAAGTRMTWGHQRVAAIVCLCAGATVVLMVGDLSNAVERTRWSTDLPNHLAQGAGIAVLGGLLAALCGAIAAHDRPPGWYVSLFLALDVGTVTFDRSFPREARLAQLLGPSLLILPFVAVLVLAMLLGSWGR